MTIRARRKLEPDVIRQNAVEALRKLALLTLTPVKIEMGKDLQDKVKRQPLELAQAKVAAAAGFLPYLKQKQVSGFFDTFHSKLVSVGHHWKKHQAHGDLLDDLEDLGGLAACPPIPRRRIVRCMVLCYIGEPGGYGWYGRNREVFYSDVAAHRIFKMLKAAGDLVRGDVEDAGSEGEIKTAMKNQHIARRYEELVDLTEPRQ